jgi:hypothetical protein
MNETLMTIMWTIFGAIGTMLLGLISAGIVSLVKATINNTAEMKVLSNTIKDLAKVPAKIDKIKSDVDSIHNWKREHEKKYP